MDSDYEFDVFPKKAAAKIATSQELKELESAWQLGTSHAEVALANTVLNCNAVLPILALALPKGII